MEECKHECGCTKQADKLDEIVTLQRSFMDRMKVDYFPVTMRDERNIVRHEEHPTTQRMEIQTRDMLFAICCELGEIGDEINWKPWKSTTKDIDLDLLYTELIDVLHFIVEIMIIWGMDANLISQYYKAKMELNHERQDRGY